MHQGLPDEAVVAMKPGADEDAVTYLRINLLERDRKSKVKGGTDERGDGTQTITVVSRPDAQAISGGWMAMYKPSRLPRGVDEEAIRD